MDTNNFYHIALNVTLKSNLSNRQQAKLKKATAYSF